MKKLALINSFCNTEEKITVLKENLNYLKSLNIDTLLYSPISLPKDVLDLADYTFITKENPIIKWPIRGIIHWATITPAKFIIITPDYGWASIYQFKKLSEIAATFDYDYYFWFLYDTQIDSVVTETLKIPNKKLFFNSAKTSQGVKCGNVFASFNKTNLVEFANLLNIEDYVENTNGKINEYYTEKIAEKIDANFSSHIIYDSIDEHSNISFNLAPKELPFKIFFNNEGLFSLCVYEVKDELDSFKLCINDNFIEHNFINSILNTEIDCTEIYNLVFSYKDELYSLNHHLFSSLLYKIENL